MHTSPITPTVYIARSSTLQDKGIANQALANGLFETTFHMAHVLQTPGMLHVLQISERAALAAKLDTSL